MPTRQVAIVSVLLLMSLSPAFSEHSAEHRSAARQCQSVTNGLAKYVEFLTWTENDEQVPIDGILAKPDGQGPFPGIVVLHGSGGIRPPRCYQGALDLVTGWGYAALLIDSYSTGVPEQDGWRRRSIFEQAIDAHAGRKFLATLPDVDGRRIGLIGWSRGGGATLAAVRADKIFRFEGEASFRAALAFYPVCLVDLENVVTPLLILIGDADVVTPAENCRRLMAAMAQGTAVDLKVYPGAGHVFDAPWAITYDAAAAEDAFRRARELFATHFR